MDICDYKIKRKTYYVSLANSFGDMNGGIDIPLSRTIMPNVENIVIEEIKKYGKECGLGKYLPIGSSIIIDYDENKSLVVSLTMLMPNDVSKTKNAFYSVLATLYNIFINKKENIKDVDIIMTSMCCGIGHMKVEDCVEQTLAAIRLFPKYKPQKINKNVIIFEPNFDEQPNKFRN